MSMISPVQSSPIIRESSTRDTRTAVRWEGFVEKVGFEPGVKE